MTDRELLELAAKAAGYEWTGYFGDDEVECQYFDIGLGEEVVPWNPLTDDGDALRLAVKLGLTTAQLITNREVEVNDYDETVLISEFDGPDPYAATRRAIVRAAAEIGRNMP
jgi:hypothetical protein